MKKLQIERAADEKPPEVKEEHDKNGASKSPSKEKEEDKAKIRVDIGQRGGFGKFRFLKKEGDNSKERKDEAKEEKATENEPTIELRKSESSKQPSQSEKEKEKESAVGKDAKKEIKINIKLSGRQFVPMSVQKAATPSSQPAKHSTVKAKPPPPPPPVSSMKPSKAKTASKIDFKPKHSLDSFLSIGGKGKALPVFKEVEKKQAAPSQDEIAAAFGGTKSKEESEKEKTSESDKPSSEDGHKPSFSDTLKKMLFASSQKGDDKPDAEENQESEEKSSFASIFNTMLSGIQPGIPGIDDDDELKPPGT